MRRWFEALAAAGMALLIVGLLLACWAPAYVGGNPPPRQWHRGPGDRPMRR